MDLLASRTKQLGAACAAQLDRAPPCQGAVPTGEGAMGYSRGPASEDWVRGAPINSALSSQAHRGALSVPADAPHAVTEAVWAS